MCAVCCVLCAVCGVRCAVCCRYCMLMRCYSPSSFPPPWYRYGHGTVAFGMLGDWCSVEAFCPGSSDKCLSNPGWTSGDATSSFYFVANLKTMVNMAKAIGNTADFATYSAALALATAAYVQQYVIRRIMCDTASYYTRYIPLYTPLLPAPMCTHYMYIH